MSGFLAWLEQMKPVTLVICFLLLVVIFVCAWFLPDEHAWTMLGQIVTGLLRGLLPS